MNALVAQIQRKLESTPPKLLNLPGLELRDSAVLVPLVERGGAPHVIFTRRLETLRSHGGQYSFPGGATDPEDPTPVHTALRETEEELRIPRAAVKVIGMLDELPTITQYRIRPVVGVVPSELAYEPSPEEIAEVVEVPLLRLLDPASTRTERWMLRGAARDVFLYDYQGHVIWGATARIVRNFLEVIADVPALREYLEARA